MRTSQAGIDLIKRMEGYRAVAYKCPAGVWTIGYGTTRGVTEGMTVNAEEAERMLRSHLVRDEVMLTALNLPIKQNQFDALVSFCYNVGFWAFAKSGLHRAIKADPAGEAVAAEWRRWTKAGGKTLPGLVKRREAELALYFN